MPDIVNGHMLADSRETGAIGVMHLKRFWQKSIAKRDGRLDAMAFQEEWNLDFSLLSALGLGLEQTVKHLYLEKPTFEQFENWILELNGGVIQSERVEEFNRIVVGDKDPDTHEAVVDKIIDDEDLKYWEENGYVIIREA